MPFNSRHMAREYAGGSVGGILRKGGSSNANAAVSNVTVNTGETRQVDLLVFGYACKVFRDDAKARDIDQGKQLIPWMGDSNLKIDRYDVRGALYDLAPYEPPPGGYGNRLDYLTAEEQRAEQLCEEERYLYLYNNEEEHILQQEEDLKRLQQESSDCGSYNQVAFQYGSDAPNGNSGVQHGPLREDGTNSPTSEDADQVFSLPRNFEVPASIQLPETMKQHAIIEKTARFIAFQGVQMEILLKAKQSNNAQFEFLSLNSPLNPYYKFVTNAIKNGTYPLQETPKEPDADTENFSAQGGSMGNITKAKPVITVPTIKYKPSANCSYTQLISKIKGVPLPSVLEENTSTANADSPTSATTSSGDNFMPVLLQYNGQTYVTAEAEEVTCNSNSNSNLDMPVESKVQILSNSSALALAQNYSSDSDESEEEKPETPVPKPEPVLNFAIPPDYLQSIIDKTATYVIKNGRQFEETLRTKSEDRFIFLLPENEFYPYYMYKITDDPDAASKEQKTRKAAAVAAALLSKKGIIGDKTIPPVSFSIKAKEENATTVLQPGLPQDASDDDEVDNDNDGEKGVRDVSQNRVLPEHVQKVIQLVESQLMARNAQMASASATAPNAGRTNNTAVRSRFDIDYNTAINSKTQVKSTKAELERNALFEQQQQNRQKKLKKAEEKVKDKLAQIAREKLGGLITKEKQLQLERKRKAMAFLTQIKGPPNSINEVDDEDDAIMEKISDLNDDENVSDDSDASVHSIPISSYGPDEKTDDEIEETNPCVTDHMVYISTTKTKLDETNGQEKKNTIDKPTRTNNVNDEIATATVLLSDDDDVQVVSEIKASTMPQRVGERHRIKTSLKRPSREVIISTRKRNRKCSTESICSSAESDISEMGKNISKSRSHKSSKSKKSSKKSKHKKKSKKRARSRSKSRSESLAKHRKQRRRSRSRSPERQSTRSVAYYSRSCSRESETSPASHRRHHSKHHASNNRSSYTSSSTKRKEKRRKSER